VIIQAYHAGHKNPEVLLCPPAESRFFGYTKRHVHRRYLCPKYLKQSFQEFAAQSVLEMPLRRG
jgi:hypothetical protein